MIKTRVKALLLSISILLSCGLADVGYGQTHNTDLQVKKDEVNGKEAGITIDLSDTLQSNPVDFEDSTIIEIVKDEYIPTIFLESVNFSDAWFVHEADFSNE